MGYDKVVDSAFLDAGLGSIAAAIREKCEGEQALVFPGGFVEAVESIKVGGSGAALKVMAPEGSTITISKGDESYTSEQSTAVFTGLGSGVWRIDYSNGGQSAYTTIEILADYSTSVFYGEMRYYYNKGDECTSVTNGWRGMNIRAAEGWATGSLNIGSTSIDISVNGSSAAASPKYLLPLAEIKTLYITISAPDVAGDERDQVVMWLSNSAGSNSDVYYSKKQILHDGMNTVDVSDLSSNLYLLIDVASDYARTVRIESVAAELV